MSTILTFHFRTETSPHNTINYPSQLKPRIKRRNTNQISCRKLTCFMSVLLSKSYLVFPGNFPGQKTICWNTDHRTNYFASCLFTLLSTSTVHSLSVPRMSGLTTGRFTNQTLKKAWIPTIIGYTKRVPNARWKKPSVQKIASHFLCIISNRWLL